MTSPYLVTRPLMPPFESILPSLESVWEAQWLTNGGRLHAELEERLAAWLDVPFVALFSNGTLALAAAVRVALGEPRPGDEVVTSPYSFVASAQAIVLAGYTPRFVDVSAGSPNLDPDSVESAIGARTRGIMPIHCYGIPADVEAFDAMSRRTGIPVVYDAAHAFGVRHGAAALASFGSLAALSFHATKIFHTAEGGGVVAHTAEDYAALKRLRNFGFTGDDFAEGWGFNAKMSELSAAVGLQVLPLVRDEIARRRVIAERYRHRLARTAGIRLIRPADETGHNFGYLPVAVEDSFPLSRDDLRDSLAEIGVFARRYFHPLISEMRYFADREPGGPFPNASGLSDRVLCLPLYGRLTDDDVDLIVDGIDDAAAAASAA